ncbi:amino acid ABC transporter ATP-binding protein (PAAT family) [Hydrogenispora ethanolica]|uniref:Amino acid ABC transporter ATP-binding protein (PAAT family) n=1 Tax=Hydrogenispora ethanolica TaxID=1082276 RepID=A0A4R1RD34_HYDET|nr:amino acid ABC transporter ATP-binding protein [Hydrogenispora ethanolica]TCL63748.1 amino acid ABC transporter ATP-binding protein (PAAT family) [Hydrogenispora ethanolica]
MLEVSDLMKNYGRKQALDGVDLRVEKGETVVIMGPSGCGKSTLIRCINRLTEPDSGAIRLAGQPITDLNLHELLAVRRKIGFVFQHFNLIRRLTALDNVAMPLRLQGVSVEEANRRAECALGKVGLGTKLQDRPDELSGGEQQRVGIARALALEPEIMLWDEPTASLDPILIGEVLEVMEELVQEGNTTMLIVTHELSFARRAADRIVFMDKGRVVEEGPPQQVFEHPTSEIGKKYHQLLRH